MRNRSGLLGSMTTKLIACLLILLCFAIGAVGLVLPIIPGLLFVAIALMLLARQFPALDRKLRESRTFRGYLDGADGFMGLSFPKKIQYGCLLCLQIFIDTIAFLVYLASKVLGFAVVKYQSYR